MQSRAAQPLKSQERDQESSKEKDTAIFSKQARLKLLRISKRGNPPRGKTIKKLIKKVTGSFNPVRSLQAGSLRIS